MKVLSINAPAKINLALQVLNKRQDGFHNINSIMTRIPISDKLRFEDADSLQFSCNVDLGIPDELNLAYRAAENFFQAFGIKPSVKISLSKVIPSGGGLGGGSSDAAAVLKGLTNFYDLHNNDDKLFELACELGSDVPFFLKSGSAIATSRGEKLDYFNFTLPWSVLLICPTYKVNTGEAYAHLKRTEAYYARPFAYKRLMTLITDHPQVMRLTFRNDFIYNDMEHISEIRFLIQKMYDSGALFASMSGSGSCCFGLYRDNRELHQSDKYFENYKTLFGKF